MQWREALLTTETPVLIPEAPSPKLSTWDTAMLPDPLGAGVGFYSNCSPLGTKELEAATGTLVL